MNKDFKIVSALCLAYLSELGATKIQDERLVSLAEELLPELEEISKEALPYFMNGFIRFYNEHKDDAT